MGRERRPRPRHFRRHKDEDNDNGIGNDKERQALFCESPQPYYFCHRSSQSRSSQTQITLCRCLPSLVFCLIFSTLIKTEQNRTTKGRTEQDKARRNKTTRQDMNWHDTQHNKTRLRGENEDTGLRLGLGWLRLCFFFCPPHIVDLVIERHVFGFTKR